MPQFTENLRARHWFRSRAELIQTASDAVSLARGEQNEEFAASSMKKAKEYGLEMFMSEKQMHYLCKLADRVPPLPVEDTDAER